MDIDVDRELLNSVFDQPTMRYILLYMYLVRFNVFRNLEEEDLVDIFDQLYDPSFKNQITVGNLKRMFPGDIIREMFAFNIVTNIKNYKSFLAKEDDFQVRMLDVYLDETKENIMFSEESILGIIKPFFPRVTEKKISDALKNLRGIMCLHSACTHPLVHKYNNDYVLDDELYDIIFFLGNPYLALRLEQLVVSMKDKIDEINKEVEKYLKVFYNDSLKSSFIKMIKKAIKWNEENNEEGNYLKYITVKGRKLPEKFNPSEYVQNMEIYDEWWNTFNKFIGYKYDCINASLQIEDIEAYYSGPKQKISYLTFIEKVTSNEEEISNVIKNSLVEIRKNLKEANDTMENIPIKEVKLLNLDVERAVIEHEKEEDE
ncbi:MAG: hypothetical protein GF364_17075 [Candidatus Lokiarchaeota archaeon]|nr:hypothetical protein [Candidatus Lokiarchaeota archaeon]